MARSDDPTRPARPAFDAAVALRQETPGSWRGTVAQGWDIGGVPNGGYLAALGLHALGETVVGRDPAVVTASYLAPAAAGDVEVTVEAIAEGRRRSTSRACLHQGGRLTTEVTALFGPPLDAPDPPDYLSAEPPDLPGPDECVHPTPDHETGFPPPITDHVELRIRPQDAGFVTGAFSGAATIDGWMRFADGRPPDLLSLPLFADAFPPAVFNAGLPLSWVPTVQLTVHLRARPGPGWLRGAFRTRLVAQEYLEEDGDLWDADGRLVAMSRQLALAPRP